MQQCVALSRATSVAACIRQEAIGAGERASMLLDTAGLLPLVAKFELEYRSDELDAPFTMRCGEQNCSLARAQPCDDFG